MTWQTCVENVGRLWREDWPSLLVCGIVVGFFALLLLVQRRDRQRRERDEAEAHRQRLQMCLDPEGWQR